MSYDVHYVPLRSRDISGVDLVTKISQQINTILVSKFSMSDNSANLSSCIKSIFTPDMEKCFSDYKITLQIRYAYRSFSEILFDMVTDLITYEQSAFRSKMDQVALSLGLHYSYIKSDPSQNHITDLLYQFPTHREIFKAHYKKSEIRESGKESGATTTNKIYFYLDNSKPLLEHIKNFFLAIHSAIDSTDSLLAPRINRELLSNRPSGASVGLINSNIINEDPISTATRFPEIDGRYGKKKYITDRTGDNTNFFKAVDPSYGRPVIAPRTRVETLLDPKSPESIFKISDLLNDDKISPTEFTSENYDYVEDKSTLVEGEKLIMFNNNTSTRNSISNITYNTTSGSIKYQKDLPHIYFFRRKTAGGNNDMYYQKYLKYKAKYLKLKNYL